MMRLFNAGAVVEFEASQLLFHPCTVLSKASVEIAEQSFTCKGGDLEVVCHCSFL